MIAFTYARLEADRRRYTLFERLADALYTATIDLQDQRAVPIGIRQGRRILYRHSDLVALAAAHQALLSAKDHWPLLQALGAIAAARSAPG
jgi:hypothetical protein